MVEIIKRGELRGDRVHEVTCRVCKSELRFAEREAKHVHDQRDGGFLSINCPVCGSVVSKDYHP